MLLISFLIAVSAVPTVVSKGTITTSCTDSSATLTCPTSQGEFECRHSPKQCFTTPCPQYDCCAVGTTECHTPRNVDQSCGGNARPVNRCWSELTCYYGPNPSNIQDLPGTCLTRLCAQCRELADSNSCLDDGSCQVSGGAECGDSLSGEFVRVCPPNFECADSTNQKGLPVSKCIHSNCVHCKNCQMRDDGTCTGVSTPGGPCGGFTSVPDYSCPSGYSCWRDPAIQNIAERSGECMQDTCVDCLNKKACEQGQNGECYVYGDVGDSCGGRTTPPIRRCKDGLKCHAPNANVDQPGECVEDNACNPSPCQKGETCSLCKNINGYCCNAAVDPVDPCKPSPCNDDETCSPCRNIAGYCCTAPADPCDPNPCGKGETCSACNTNADGFCCKKDDPVEPCNGACASTQECVAAQCVGGVGSKCGTEPHVCRDGLVCGDDGVCAEKTPCVPSPCAKGETCRLCRNQQGYCCDGPEPECPERKCWHYLYVREHAVEQVPSCDKRSALLWGDCKLKGDKCLYHAARCKDQLPEIKQAEPATVLDVDLEADGVQSKDEAQELLKSAIAAYCEKNSDNLSCKSPRVECDNSACKATVQADRELSQDEIASLEQDVSDREGISSVKSSTVAEAGAGSESQSMTENILVESSATRLSFKLF